MSDFASVSDGSLTVSSNNETAEEMLSALNQAEESEEPRQFKDVKSAEPAKPVKPVKAKAAAPAEKERDEETGRFKPSKPAEDAEGEKPSEKQKAKADSEGEGEDPDVSDVKNPKVKERILKATRDAAEKGRALRAAEEREQRLLGRLEAIEARISKPAEAPKPPEQARAQAPDDDPEPNPDDAKYAEGQFDPAYIKDAGRWAARQEWRSQQTKHAEKNRADGARRFVEERGAKVDQGIAEAGGDQFLESLSDEVRSLEPSFVAMANGKKPTAANALADEFLRMGEHAPRLMRFLTEHPDVLQRLTSPTLNPLQFERAMGRIEQQLDAGQGAATAGNPAPKPVSKAPAPARPVAGALTATIDDGPDESLPLMAYVARENARSARRKPVARW